MEIALEKAKQNKLFYVVTNGIIYDPSTQKCLILQRSKRETAHPGLWGVVGGKLEWGDLENNPPSRMNHDIPNWEGLLEQQLYRETKEESGLEVGEPKFLLTTVYLRPDGIPVAMIKFGLKYLSGEVVIQEDMEDFAWVDKEEVKEYETIGGIAEEVSRTIELYK